MYELINEKFIEIKEYKGQRVVTFKDIDTVHNRPDGTARKRFNDNKKHLVEGEDYFKICASEIRTHKIMEISPKTREDIILLTKSGYLMVVKSFTDDLAWKVQRQLVNAYFRSRQIQKQKNYSSIDQSAIIMMIKELCEQNCELNNKIDRLNNKIEELNHENNKNIHEFTTIIRMLCESVFKKRSGKSKSNNHRFI